MGVMEKWELQTNIKISDKDQEETLKAGHKLTAYCGGNLTGR